MTLSNRDQQILKRYLRRKARWEQEPVPNETHTEEPTPTSPIVLPNGDSRITRQGDMYVISNVILYDLDGQPHTSYDHILLDTQAITETVRKGLKKQTVTPKKTQPNWLDFHKQQGTTLPSLPLVYAILEAIYDNQQNTVAQELKESLAQDWQQWLATSTRFNYSKNETRHNIGTPDEILIVQEIPDTNQYLEQLVTATAWEKPLQAMFMTQDIQKIPHVTEMYDTRKGYLWTPTSSREIERAAFVGFSLGSFNVDGGSLSDVGRSRGVRTGGSP